MEGGIQGGCVRACLRACLPACLPVCLSVCLSVKSREIQRMAVLVMSGSVCMVCILSWLLY